MIEKAVEEDDTIMEKYLEGSEPTTEELKLCIRKGTLKGSFVPVLTGSAFKNKGVQPLLDAVIDYMPSPIDVESVKGSEVDNDAVEIGMRVKAVWKPEEEWTYAMDNIRYWKPLENESDKGGK